MKIRCHNCLEEFEVKYSFYTEKDSIITQVVMVISCPYCHQLNEIVFKPLKKEEKKLLKKHKIKKVKENAKNYIG